VAVDHYWLLTAAHVADDGGLGNLNIAGETYTQQEVVFHSSADLALVRYDKPFPGYYPLHDGEIHNGKNGPQRVYYELVMAGYGKTGTVTQTTFTNGPGGNGTKRWGTNRGVSETTVNANVGGSVGEVSTKCFRMTFDLSDTEFEGGAAQYDSGGPVFINTEAGWKLTGINLYLTGSDPYTGNYASMIHDYIDWITDDIPDYDTDMDGLPDWWELLYEGDETSMDPEGHADSDGFTNLEEWWTDTIPTDGNSFLKIINTTATNLTFNSSSNRQYQLLYRAVLDNSNVTWQAEGGWFVGSDVQTVLPVPTPASNCFYRVRARL
jgi:hypothetical protein